MPACNEKRPVPSGRFFRLSFSGGIAQLARSPSGEVTEWSIVPDSKSGVSETAPWVRIPPSPPVSRLDNRGQHLPASSYSLLVFTCAFPLNSSGLEPIAPIGWIVSDRAPPAARRNYSALVSPPMRVIGPLLALPERQPSPQPSHSHSSHELVDHRQADHLWWHRALRSTALYRRSRHSRALPSRTPRPVSPARRRHPGHQLLGRDDLIFPP